jgi:hypothetical protein
MSFADIFRGARGLSRPPIDEVEDGQCCGQFVHGSLPDEPIAGGGRAAKPERP